MTSQTESGRRVSAYAAIRHIPLRVLSRFSNGGLSTLEAGRVFHPTRPAPPCDRRADEPLASGLTEPEEDPEMETIQSTEPLVDTVEAGEITVISIRTQMLTDAESIARVVDEIRSISHQGRPPNLLLDFHGVKRLSVEFVSEMKRVTDDVETRCGTIRCCSLRKETRALLRTLGLEVLYVGNSVGHAVMRHAACLAKQDRP